MELKIGPNVPLLQTSLIVWVYLWDVLSSPIIISLFTISFPLFKIFRCKFLFSVMEINVSKQAKCELSNINPISHLELGNGHELIKVLLLRLRSMVALKVGSSFSNVFSSNPLFLILAFNSHAFALVCNSIDSNSSYIEMYFLSRLLSGIFSVLEPS